MKSKFPYINKNVLKRQVLSNAKSTFLAQCFFSMPPENVFKQYGNEILRQNVLGIFHAGCI